MSLQIRAATEADIDTILHLIRQLAIYEKEPDAAVATRADLLRDGFGERPKFYVDLAFWNDEPAGFCFYFYNYSTWLGQPGLYLEDLFVEPDFRGKGIGKSLLVYLAKKAVAENCGRFEWQCLDWNQPSIDFYEALGAKAMREWVPFRAEGEALLRLSQM